MLYDRDTTKYYLEQTRQKSQLSANGLANASNPNPNPNHIYPTSTPQQLTGSQSTTYNTSSTMVAAAATRLQSAAVPNNQKGNNTRTALLNSGSQNLGVSSSSYERSGKLRISHLQSKLSEVTSFNKKQRFGTLTGGEQNTTTDHYNQNGVGSKHRKSESIGTLGTSFNRQSTRPTEQWAAGGQQSYQSAVMPQHHHNHHHHHSAKPSIMHGGDFATTNSNKHNYSSHVMNQNNANSSSYSTTITAPRTVDQIKRRLMGGNSGGTHHHHSRGDRASLNHTSKVIQRMGSVNCRNSSSFQYEQQKHMSQDYRSSLRKEESLKEFKSEKSSPERLVNIVTPSQMTESKKSRSKQGNKTLVGSFSSSYQNHRSSYPGSRQHTTKASQAQAQNNYHHMVNTGGSSGSHLMGSRLQSQPTATNLGENSNNYGRGVQRLNSFKLVTPLKRQRSANSRSQSASKSRSRQRISSIHRSTSGLQRKLQLVGGTSSGSGVIGGFGVKMSHNSGQHIVKRNEAIRMPKRLYNQRRKTISQSSHKKKSNRSLSELSKSGKSPTRIASHRSNTRSLSARKQRNSAKKSQTNQRIEINYRTEPRVSQQKQYPYQPHQQLSPSKQQLQQVQLHVAENDGHITGKFRSFQTSTELVPNNYKNSKKSSKKQSTTNLHTLIHHEQGEGSKTMMNKQQRNNYYLQTEDDLLDTQTCSSEDSPLRADTRVQRAAELTAKRYLEDIKQRVDVCNRDTQLMYDPLDMRDAARQIHHRQGARLEKLKMEMQESLRQTQNLKGCLESNSNYHRETRDWNQKETRQSRKQEVSPFNSLVLGFSEKMKQYATNLVEHTELKRRRDQETLRASYRTNNVAFRSPLTPKKRSLSGKKFKSQSPSSKKSQRSSSKKKSRKSNKKDSTKRRSVSAPKSRSKSKKSRISSRLSSTKSVKSKVSSAKKSSARRSRSKKNSVFKTVKRDIFKSTNGYSNYGGVGGVGKASSTLSLKQAYVPIRVTTSTTKRSKQNSAMRSLSRPKVTRTQEIARKCNRLSAQRFAADLLPPQRKLIQSKSRSKTPLRLKSQNSKKTSKSKQSVSRSRSKSIPKRKRSKTPTKSAKLKKQQISNLVQPPAALSNQMNTPAAAMGTIVTQQMTPIHKILRNTITPAGEPTLMARYGSSVVNTARKRVQICSRRLRDITALTSSSESSQESADYEESLERQRKDLSPWQKACIKKQLPQYMR